MEAKYEFTKSELVDAFIKWDKDNEENPDSFEEINTSLECAKNQVETLLSYLEK